MVIDYETTSICPQCASDAPAHYESNSEGVFLVGECHEHGIYKEHVEKDEDFFRWGYEQEYQPARGNLVLPITYRCNLACKYCYTLSNTKLAVPDRPLDAILDLIGSYGGNVSLIGGEPTLREDLFEVISAARKMPNVDKVSVCTNGQRLRDMEYVKGLKDSGVDYVFFSFNDAEYEMSSQVHKNKLQALDNCRKLRVPVWLQGTISDLHQLDSIVPVLRKFKKIIFKATLRAVKDFGVDRPAKEIFVSDILEYLGKKEDCLKGNNPFNRRIELEGKEVKVCSWVQDTSRMDPVDYDYVISDDTMTKFHRGMRIDEILLRERLFGKDAVEPDSQRLKSVLKTVSA